MIPDPKLSQLTTDGNFRAKVQAILDDLKAKGYDAYIAEAKRTPAQQREKVRLGYSKTLRSYHLKRGSDGEGKAADIIHRAKGWNVSKRFRLMLGSSCWAHGVGWGGLFDIKNKKAIQQAIQTLRDAGWPEDHPAYEIRLGWDEAHCQYDSNWPTFP